MSFTLSYNGLCTTTSLAAMGISTTAFVAPWVDFLRQSFAHIVPWSVCAFSIVLADLVTGLYKSDKLGVKIRFSRACRETIMKIITYFTAIMAACFFNVIAGWDGGLERGVCIAIYFIEGVSVVSNVLKVHGYHLDLRSVLRIAASKLGFDKEDAEHLIEKTDEL